MVETVPAPHSEAWRIAVRGLSIDLDDRAIAQLANFRDLILAANQRVNLTAIRDPQGIDFRLVLESLRLVPVVDTLLRDCAETTIVDIGTGSGIPGIPLAIALPHARITLVEATAKKSRFNHFAIETLKLGNATAVNARAEDLARSAIWRESQELAIARAVGPLATLLELSIPLIRVGGSALFPKGEISDRERDQGRRAVKVLGATLRETVKLPKVDGCPVTQLVIADKLEPILDQYPRRSGFPAREPLGG